jgi:NAD(P)-dependent dehydrogenase (short-subunit alcohol dehydrogenase family)
VALDVTRESDWEAAVAAVRTAFGAPTAVVNNAGYLKAAAIEVATLDDWQRTMDVNAGGAFLGCRYGVREMREAGGSIVNVASTMGLRGIARHPAYCASKAAVRLLTRSVARHCGERRYPVRVNAVLPGAVETEMLLQNVAAGDDAAAFLDAIRAAHPIGRLGRPEDIAAAVAFLISGDAAFVTGTDLVVDGGGMA